MSKRRKLFFSVLLAVILPLQTGVARAFHCDDGVPPTAAHEAGPHDHGDGHPHHHHDSDSKKSPMDGASGHHSSCPANSSLSLPVTDLSIPMDPSADAPPASSDSPSPHYTVDRLERPPRLILA